MVPFAGSGVTVLRREEKLPLEREQAEALARDLEATIAPVESRIFTVYFDRPDGALARRATSSPGDCMKVRARTYEPDRDGGAGDMVLETKRERFGVTSKQRIRLARSGLRAAVERSFAGALGPLAPTVAVSFRRRVFQSAPEWRVTLDDEVSFHEAGWEVFDRDAPRRLALPPAFAVEPRVIVEVKHGPHGLPRWLAAVSRGAQPYSKFGAAVERLPHRDAGGS